MVLVMLCIKLDWRAVAVPMADTTFSAENVNDMIPLNYLFIIMIFKDQRTSTTNVVYVSLVLPEILKKSESIEAMMVQIQ